MRNDLTRDAFKGEKRMTRSRKRVASTVILTLILGLLAGFSTIGADVNTITAIRFLNPPAPGSLPVVTSAVVGQTVIVEWTVTVQTTSSTLLGGTLTRRIKSPGSPTWNVLNTIDDPITGSDSYTVTYTLVPAVAGGNYVVDGIYDGCDTCTPTLGASSQLSATLPVTKADTTTSVVTAPTSSVTGQNVTLTATVVTNAPGSGTATGTVSFYADASLIGTDVLDGSGEATVSTSFDSIGTKTITAEYLGDTNYNGDETQTGDDPGPPVDHTVSKANTTVAITSDAPDASIVGQPYTVSGTVTVDSPGTGTPTGTVDVDDAGTDTCAATLQPDGSWSCVLTSTAVGSPRTITADYSGDTHYNAPATPPTETHTVNAADTTTMVSSSQSPSVSGESVAFTATVSAASPGSGTLANGTDLVTFEYSVHGLNTWTTMGTADLTGGTASLGYTLPGAGSWDIKASYDGSADSNYNSSDNSAALFEQTVNKADTTVSFHATTPDGPDPSVVGQSYTVMGTIQIDTPGGGSLDSVTVTIDDGNGNSCDAPVVSGAWTCATLKSTTAGAKTLTATFAGNANFNGSTDTESHTVDPADTITAITGTNLGTDTVVGESYTVSGTVTPTNANGITTTTGTVEVSDGTATCTDATLVWNAAGGYWDWSCPYSPVPPPPNNPLTSTTAGTKSITATYLGDANYNADATLDGDSPGPPVSHTVNPASTTTVITSLPAGATVVGESYTVSGMVTPAHGWDSASTTGTVEVSDGTDTCTDTTLTWDTTDDWWVWSCDLVSTTAGVDKTIRATFDPTEYSGSPPGEDANYETSYDEADHTVDEAATALAFTSVTPSPSIVGEPYTVEGTISVTSPGAGVPTGDVTVSDGSDSGSGTITPGGTWSCTFASMTAGTTLTATYPEGADTNYLGDTETYTSHSVDPANTTTTVSSSKNASVTGESVTFTATVSAASPGSGIPIGTVTFYKGSVAGGNEIGSPTERTLSGGNATVPTSFDASEDPVTIIAVYDEDESTSDDDPDYKKSTSPNYTQNVNKADTIVSFHGTTSDNPDPSVVGQSYTVMGTIQISSPGLGSLDGVTVTIDDGNGNSCNATVVSGDWTCATLKSTTAGAKTLTATFSGNANYSGDTTLAGDDAGEQPVAHTVSPASTTTAITSDLTGATVVGESYTVSGTVTPAYGWDSASTTGTVEVSDNSTVPDTCTDTTLTWDTTDDWWVWSCDLVSTTVGAPKYITATFDPSETTVPPGLDPNYTTSTSGATANPHTVNAVTGTPTELEIVGSPEPVCVCQPVLLSARVTDPSTPGATNFDGCVAWSDGSAGGTFESACVCVTDCTCSDTNGGCCVVNPVGECSIYYTPAASDVGPITIMAQYVDDVDDTYADSNYASIALTVVKRPTHTEISGTPGTVYIHEPTTLSAAVLDLATECCGSCDDPPYTTGVAYSRVAGSPGSGTVGSSAYTPTAADADQETHTLRGVYLGNDTYEASSGTFALDVKKRPVVVSMTEIPEAVFIGQGVIVRATVTEAAGLPGSSDFTVDDSSPTVTFDDLNRNGVFVGTVKISHTSTQIVYQAIYVPGAGDAGTVTIRATYDGSSVYQGATGDTTLTVALRPSSVSVVPDPASVYVDQRTEVTVTVNDLGPSGYSGTPSGTVKLATSGDGDFYTTETGSILVDVDGIGLTGGGVEAWYEPETAEEAIVDHILTATYIAASGDPLDPSTQVFENATGSVPVSVKRRETETTVTANPDSFIYDDVNGVTGTSSITVTIEDISPGTQSRAGGKLTLFVPGDDIGSFNVTSTGHTSISGNNSDKVIIRWISASYGGDRRTVYATYTLIEDTQPLHPIIAIFEPTDNKHMGSAGSAEIEVEFDESSYVDPPSQPAAGFGSDGVVACGLIDETGLSGVINFGSMLRTYEGIITVMDWGATVLQLFPDVLVDVTDPAWSVIHLIYQVAVVDMDTDGIPDAFELVYVWDGLNPYDPDSDNDGIWDGDEIALAGGQYYPNILDTSFSWSRPNPRHPDSDRDGISDGDEYYTFLTNCCDPDTDDDGLLDGQELATSTAFDATGYESVTLPSTSPRTDLRDQSDPFVADTDSDGLRDDIEFAEGCPYVNDDDSDDDGLQDGFEDVDQNGSWTTVTIGTSSTQVPSGETNVCDADTDGDGLSDGEEAGLFGGYPTTGASGLVAVTPKGVSATVGSEGADLGATIPALDVDSDNDGLTDYEEVNVTMTDPLDADTDDDTISDGDEVATWDYADARDHANPLMADTDGDGLTDDLEALDIVAKVRLDAVIPIVEGCPYVNDDDSDDDGLQDGYEDGNKDGWYGYAEYPATWGYKIALGNSSSQAYYESPLTRWETDPCDADSDDDGLTDGEEIGLFGEGWVTPQAVSSSPGVHGVPLTDTIAALDDDSDNDGLSDYEEVNITGTNPLDADTDDDTITDANELIATGGTWPKRTFYQESDPLDPDTDDDDLPDAIEYPGTGLGNPSSSFFRGGGSGSEIGGNPDTTCPYVNDADSDDDGLQDGYEDDDHDGVVESTDQDGIWNNYTTS
jgi:hypothetical protein